MSGASEERIRLSDRVQAYTCEKRESNTVLANTEHILIVQMHGF